MCQVHGFVGRRDEEGLFKWVERVGVALQPVLCLVFGISLLMQFYVLILVNFRAFKIHRVVYSS